jgi:hypothetical protein
MFLLKTILIFFCQYKNNFVKQYSNTFLKTNVYDYHLNENDENEIKNITADEKNIVTINNSDNIRKTNVRNDIRGYDERYPLIENNNCEVLNICKDFVKFEVLNFITNVNETIENKIKCLNENSFLFYDNINKIYEKINENNNDVKPFNIKAGGLNDDFDREDF